MEVVVSAAVLLLVVLGVMAAMDSVAGTAGANKARTVAAALAEKDQEELRSLKTADLNDIRSLIPGPRTVNVDGVQYTITSDATIVTDATGEDISCALEDGSGSFVRITSTVTSPATGAKVKPVVLSSIVAPEPGSGTLVARVVNAENNPVKNLPVQATGPESKTKSTNDAGCAVFGAMTAGAYEVRVSQLGWVNTEGEQDVVKTATVAAGTLTTVDFVYDLGATVNVTVRTRYGAPVATPLDPASSVVAAHTGILTGFRIFPEAAPLPATAHTLPRLFPFEDPYLIYSGRCTGADPTQFDENYFDNPTYAGAAPTLEPGETRSITLYEPAVNINATFSQTYNNSRVYAVPRTAGCTDPASYDLGAVTATRTATNPGLPFGEYELCVQFRRSSNGNYYHRRNIIVNNNNANGTAVTNVAVTTSSPSAGGTCVV